MDVAQEVSDRSFSSWGSTLLYFLSQVDHEQVEVYHASSLLSPLRVDTTKGGYPSSTPRRTLVLMLHRHCVPLCNANYACVQLLGPRLRQEGVNYRPSD